MTITLSVSAAGRITRTGADMPYDKSKGELSLAFNFAEGWEGYTKTALLWNEPGRKTPVLLDENGAGDVPEAVIVYPVLYISVFGTTETARKTAGIYELLLDESGYGDAESIEPPAQSTYEEILGIAQSVRDDADNGVFDGAPGPQGEPGQDGADGLDLTVAQELTDAQKNTAQTNIGLAVKTLGNALVNQVEGENITISDLSPLVSDLNLFRIKGNSIQDGTPTPQNPIAIANVGDLVTVGEHEGEYAFPIVKAGKNILPVSYGTIASNNGISIEQLSDGRLHIWGTTPANSGATIYLIPRGSEIALPPGTYTLSTDLVESGANVHSVVSIRDYTADVNDIISVGGIVSRRAMTKTYTTTHNCAIYLWVPAGWSINQTIYLQLEVADAANPYEQPRASETTTGYLPQPLRKGDVWDVTGGKVIRRRAYISSSDGETVGSDWMSTTGELSAGAGVEYTLATPIEEDVTPLSVPLFTDTSVISLGTTTPPENMTGKYNRDINKALEELAAAIVALGGTI